MSFGPLVSTQWLADALGADDVTVIDASWHMPAAKRDARAEYLDAHIPRALYFDLDALSDTQNPLPHMLAPAAIFAAALSAMGVGSGDRIVVYDTINLFSAPRAWWTFRAMGHDKVAVLDGGLPKWRGEGRALERGTVQRAPRTFRAELRPALVRNIADMKDNLVSRTATVIDARPAARFHGTAPEPRAGLRSGHIPHSRSVPSSSVIDTDGTLRKPDALKDIFANAGADLSKPVVTTCGSGVTAAILALALETMGKKNIPVYDGSWSEWGGRADVPVETG